MIKVVLFPLVGEVKFSELSVGSFSQGIEFIQYVLENAKDSQRGVALSISEGGSDDFPTIHFQQVGDKYFFQVYISENVIEEHEGWNCFCTSGKSDEDSLVSTIWDEEDLEGKYFQARFSDGVLISNSLLVTEKDLGKYLSVFSDDFLEWFSLGEWKNLGG